MIIIETRWLTGNNIGFACLPMIVIKKNLHEKQARTIRHEAIHIRQQDEMFVIPFFIFYGIEFLIRWWMLGSRAKAYRAISFEREAYAQERNSEYLKTRKWFAWCTYL